MAKQKPFHNKLLAMYKANFEDIALFFYVQGITSILPSITEKEAIALFLRKMDISEDDWAHETARIQYFHTKKKYLKM